MIVEREVQAVLVQQAALGVLRQCDRRRLVEELLRGVRREDASRSGPEVPREHVREGRCRLVGEARLRSSGLRRRWRCFPKAGEVGAQVARECMNMLL